MYFDKLDDMYYIGCSSNLTKRVNEHLISMTNNRHRNSRLQRAFNDYGPPTIEILELCSLDKLHDREIYWIKEFDSFTKGFNNTNGGDGGGFGEGKHNSLYTQAEYCEILKQLALTDLSLRQVASLLNVQLDVVKHISALDSHGWLEEVMPVEYSILREKYKNSVRNNSAASKGISYPKVISPEGVEYIVDNIHAFCRDHNLQPQNMHKVLTKQRKIHKGWTCAQ